MSKANKYRRIVSLPELYHAASIPWVATFTLNKRYMHPDYNLTWRKRFRLVFRLWRNTRRIETGTSYKAHAAIAAKLFEIPRSTPGVVIECGCWQGGTTTNLSILSKMTGRTLIVYDSFEGLPDAEEGDRHAKPEAKGYYSGSVETVT